MGSSRGHKAVPIQNPMSILNIVLLSKILTVAHMGRLRGLAKSTEHPTRGAKRLPGQRAATRLGRPWRPQGPSEGQRGLINQYC